MRKLEHVNNLPSPDDGVEVEPNENPDVCPAGLKGVLNNEVPEF